MYKKLGVYIAQLPLARRISLRHTAHLGRGPTTESLKSKNPHHGHVEITGAKHAGQAFGVAIFVPFLGSCSSIRKSHVGEAQMAKQDMGVGLLREEGRHRVTLPLTYYVVNRFCLPAMSRFTR